MEEVIIDLRDQFRDKVVDVVLRVTDTFEIRLAIVGGDVGLWSANVGLWSAMSRDGTVKWSMDAFAALSVVKHG